MARAGRARREGARAALKLGRRMEVRVSRRWGGSCSSTAAVGGCSAPAAEETEEQSVPEEEERKEGVRGTGLQKQRSPGPHCKLKFHTDPKA
jgi:hypothetical protein